MAGQSDSLVGRLVSKRSIKRWARAARRADRLPIEEVRALRDEAANLRPHIDTFLSQADGRLATRDPRDVNFHTPKGTDWSWRPDMWCQPVEEAGRVAVETQTDLGHGTTLFHDCDRSEISTRQVRNVHDHYKAAFGLKLDVFQFDGSFMSLVIDLPEAATEGLRKHHLIRLAVDVEMENRIEIFSRLNVQHGPNSEQIVRALPVHQTDVWVEFDLAYTNLNEKRVEKMWLDLIFEGPAMNEVLLRDLNMSRSPRAEL